MRSTRTLSGVVSRRTWTSSSSSLSEGAPWSAREPSPLSADLGKKSRGSIASARIGLGALGAAAAAEPRLGVSGGRAAGTWKQHSS